MTVETKQKFEGMATLTEDFGGFVSGLAERVFGKSRLPKSKIDLAIRSVSNFFPSFLQIMLKTFPGSVYPIDEITINNFYAQAVQRLIDRDPEVVVLNCDDYILRDQDLFPDNLFRFGILRFVVGQKQDMDFEHTSHGNLPTNTKSNRMGERASEMRPRPGYPSFDEQLDEIEKKLKTNGRSLNGSHVVMVDDNTTGGGTERRIKQLVTARGAKFDEKESIYTMKNFVGPYDAEQDRDVVLLTNVKRSASTEARESTPWGGRPIRSSLHSGITLITAPMAPFGDGEEDRSEGLLHKLSLDLIKLKTSIQILETIEDVFRGETRSDGRPFTFFSFNDFRNRLPTRHDGAGTLSPSAAIRNFTEINGHPPTSMDDIRFIDYLRLAINEVEQNIGKIKISCVCLDLVGTILRLNFPHKYLRGFKNSAIGEELSNIMIDLAKKLGYAGDILTIDVDDPISMLRDPQFNNALKLYVDWALKKMEKRFIDFYGDETVGVEKMQFFLHKHSHLPMVYHAFRELTWGQVDLENAYQLDIEQSAQNFAINIVNSGTQLTFITQAPMIHAMDILKRANLFSLVTEGKVQLITMEDQLDPDLNDTGLSNFYQELISIYSDGLLAIGDQRVDIIPVMKVGGMGYIVDGPEQLKNVFEYAKFGLPKKRRRKK